MSISSDNASMRDLVNPFKEIKMVANYFFNGIKESIRNDEKLTNYRQFFSEINAIDKKLANLNGISDSSKLDALVELEKTSTSISTGILKTTLEIKDALNNLFYMVGSSSHKEEFSLVKMILGAIGAGSSAMTVADGFGKFKNPKIKGRVGIAAIGAYAFDYLSDHLQSNFDKGSWQHHVGGSLQDLADSMALAIVPHPVAWIAAAGMFIGKTANRYFPEEIEALSQFAASVLNEYEKFKTELKEKLLKPVRYVYDIVKDNVIFTYNKLTDLWNSLPEFAANALNGYEKFKAELKEIILKPIRYLYNSVKDSVVSAYDSTIDLWNSLPEFTANVLNEYEKFKAETKKIISDSISSFNNTFQEYTAKGNEWIFNTWGSFWDSIQGMGDRADKVAGSNLNMLKESKPFDIINDFLNSLSDFPNNSFDPNRYIPAYGASIPNNYHSTNTFHNTFVLPQGTTLEQAKEVNSHLSQQREITQELNGGTS